MKFHLEFYVAISLIELQSIVQFKLSGEVATIYYQCGYYQDSACRKKNKVFIQLWECWCVWKLALLHSAVHMHTASLDNYKQLWMENGDNISQFLPVAVPTITNPLVFTQGSPSSTLTCTSTTSIATTVTFMRDGNAINGIVRDGDSVTVNGVTYQLSQTLTNRAQSTYDNVLTIAEPLSSLAGSTFSCQVENALGTSIISNSFQILGKTSGLGK